MHFSGLDALAAPLLRGEGAIFCLHEVRPPQVQFQGFEPNYQLAVSPEFLDDVISMAKRQSYALVSLSELVDHLKAHGKSRRIAVFTLDDGYINNAVLAAPVFRAHSCPYTIFVAPGFAEGRTILWWLELERIIASSRQVRGMPTETLQQKWFAFSALDRQARDLSEHDQRSFVAQLAQDCGIDWKSNTRTAMMDWEALRILSQDPLSTIGAHTLEHYAVKRLSSEQALHEMVASKKQIEQQLGKPADFFAYPYGDREQAGPRDFSLAEKAGFSASVTTRKGVITREHRHHLQSLPRIMVSGRYQNSRYVKTLMNGLPLYLNNRFKRTVVD